MGSLSSEDLSDSGPTRISFFILEMYSSLEESIDTAITVSRNPFQIPGLLTSSWNQSESVSPSGNMNNSHGARLAGDRIIEDIYRGVKRKRDGNPSDTQF